MSENKNIIKGYKVTLPNYTSKHGKDKWPWKSGETYVYNGNINMCDAGFHFCRVASDCFNYYEFNSNNHVFEVEAIGLVETQGNKSVTDKIKIGRELNWHEVLDIVNSGKDNTGYLNSGDRNSGNWNSGYLNSGNWNSGDLNSGNRNSGDLNSGNRNSGNRNSGYLNSGNRNSGYLNSGDWNSGNRNSGDLNSGNRNSGNRNSGYLNSGDWNSGNRNSGFFNSNDSTMRLFNKNTNIKYSELLNNKGVRILNWNYENNWWIYSENMSEEEKTNYPNYETCGGYLKVIPYKEACKMMWDKLDDDEKNEVKKIPYFDASVFEEITGIVVE